MQELLIETIRTDGGTQSRETIDKQYVADLAEVIKGGKRLPPIEVYGDGTDVWCADGFHRLLAHVAAGKRSIRCNVHKGSRTDAAWASCAANQEHGLRRTKGDTLNAIKMAMEVMPKMSQVSIAQHVGCSQQWVAQVTSTCNLPRPEKVTGKDGKEYPARRPRPPWEVGAGNPPPPSGVEPPATPPPPTGAVEVSEELIDQAVEIIRTTGRAATSSLQRRLRIGYTTACQIMDELEARGLVGPANGDEPREVLIEGDGVSPADSAGAPRVDAVQRPIPEHLQPLFDRSSEVQALLTQLTGVKSVLKRAEASGDVLFGDVNFNSVFAALVTAYDGIKATTPYAVCPWCQGNLSDQCRGCGHRGVLGKYRYENTVPKDMK